MKGVIKNRFFITPLYRIAAKSTSIYQIELDASHMSDQIVEPSSNIKSRQGIQVIARAASILRILENEKDGLSLGQIAKRVGLARSTVQRIVNALTDEHLLIAASLNARVKLGPAILRLAANTSFDFVTFVRPHMEKLALKLNETVDLSIRRGDRMIYVDQITGTHRLSAVSQIGESFPMFSTANGKAALSILDQKVIVGLLENNLFKETPNTITSIPELLKQLEEIRGTNVGVDEQEHVEGICALGTAFFDPLGRVFAVSIPVPSVRFYRIQKKVRQALLEFREELVNALNNS